MCEPQTVIDSINTHVEDAESGEYYLCDSFTSSGESIFTSDDLGRIILQFETNEEGNISYCQLYWSSASPVDNVVATAGLYSAVLLDALSPGNADEILDEVVEIITTGYGSAEYSEAGVSVTFSNIDFKNWLEISVV